MKTFWREQPLTEFEHKLWIETLDAHNESARRENESSRALAVGAASSGDFSKSLASALLSLGGMHGPVEPVMHLLALDDPADGVARILADGLRVPGWGISSCPGTPDPVWRRVDEMISETAIGDKVAAVTSMLQRHGEKLFPNSAAFTAATCLLLSVPPCICIYPLIAGRLVAWTEIFKSHYQKTWRVPGRSPREMTFPQEVQITG